MMKTEWRGFKGNKWTSEVNLRDFIQNNYSSYEGDESFLAAPTPATSSLAISSPAMARSLGGSLASKSSKCPRAGKPAGLARWWVLWPVGCWATKLVVAVAAPRTTDVAAAVRSLADSSVSRMPA